LRSSAMAAVKPPRPAPIIVTFMSRLLSNVPG
jgi:hypothetical protein